jgi:hypothetical protein
MISRELKIFIRLAATMAHTIGPKLSSRILSNTR